MKKEDLKIIKSGLIVVDMVNGFINEGKMADPYIRHIISENVYLIDNFINKNYPVIAFRDCHEKDAAEFKSFPEHCLKETRESELVDEIKIYEDRMKVFEKNSTNGMHAKGFIDYINSLREVNEFVITGCCTDICVMQLAISLKTYFNEINKNINVVVPMTAVETYNAPTHQRDEHNNMAFDLMNQAGIQVVNEYRKVKKYGK